MMKFFFFLLKRDFKTRFAGSAFGWFWIILQPVLNFLVYSVVFGLFFQFSVRFAGKDMSFLPYFFAGFWPWIAFQEGLGRCSGILLDYAHIIKKVKIPVGLLIPTVIVSSLIYLVIGICFFYCFMFIKFGPGSVHLAGSYLLALPLTVQLIFSIGLGLFFAIITVYLRDFAAWLPSLFNLWFFATPIFYSAEQIPERYQWIFTINPLVAILDAYRAVLFTGSIQPDILKGLGISMTASFITLAAGWFLFRRGKRWMTDVL